MANFLQCKNKFVHKFRDKFDIIIIFNSRNVWVCDNENKKEIQRTSLNILYFCENKIIVLV